VCGTALDVWIFGRPTIHTSKAVRYRTQKALVISSSLCGPTCTTRPRRRMRMSRASRPPTFHRSHTGRTGPGAKAHLLAAASSRAARPAQHLGELAARSACKRAASKISSEPGGQFAFFHEPGRPCLFFLTQSVACRASRQKISATAGCTRAPARAVFRRCGCA